MHRTPLVLCGTPGAALRTLAQGIVDRAGGSCRLRETSVDPLLLERLLNGTEGGDTVALVEAAALLDRDTRLRLLDGAVVLSVPGADAPSAALGSGLEEVHGRLVDEGGSSSSAIEEALQLWNRAPVRVAVGERSYSVDVGGAILQSRLLDLLEEYPVAVVVTDCNVDRFHGERFRAAVAATGPRVVSVVLEPGEEHKNLSTVGRLYDRALETGVDRTGVVVAMGGGVVTDISGFFAATWMRGVKWFAVPTTLLSMVDASVGGKTGVDHGLAKNAVGAFWQPRAVVCDVETLETENPRYFRSALSEVVKTAIIGDAELFGLLEQRADALLDGDPKLLTEVVTRCVRVKARIVSRDERESALRAWLNLGHTVGHALEAAGGFSTFTHGEAVSLGLVAALRLGVRWGHTPVGLAERVTSLLHRLGLPATLNRQGLTEAAGLLGHDKKRAANSVKFVIAQALGDVILTPVSLQDLREQVVTLAD